LDELNQDELNSDLLNGDLLTYPRLPWRAFLAVGAVFLLLAVAVVARESAGGATASAGPRVARCAAAAARLMSANGYPVDLMALMGPASVRRCRGLDARQFGRALADTYRIEYGRTLSRTSPNAGTPSPAYRACSARDSLRARGFGLRQGDR
jgi:hypothetical protein